MAGNRNPNNTNDNNAFVAVNSKIAQTDIDNNVQLYTKLGFPYPPIVNPSPLPVSYTPSPPGVPADGPFFDLSTSIGQLQGIEEYLFGELELANLNNPKDIQAQNTIISQIQQIDELRNNLFGQLAKIYVNLDKNSQVQRRALTDQITTSNLMEEQLADLQDGGDNAADERANKMRMVEIGEYEYLRYSAHKKTMQLVAFTSIAILFFSYCLKTELIPVAISKLGILLTLSIGGVLIVKSGWDMVTRSNQNYNRFDQSNIIEVGPAGGDTVWQHDKKFFHKLVRGTEADYRKGWKEIKNKWKNEKKQASGAIAEAEAMNNCLSNGGTWNHETNSCDFKESFQVVRAFQEKNDLGGAPFN